MNTHAHLRYIAHCSDFATAKTNVDFVCSHTWAKMYHILYNEHTL